MNRVIKYLFLLVAIITIFDCLSDTNSSSDEVICIVPLAETPVEATFTSTDLIKSDFTLRSSSSSSNANSSTCRLQRILKRLENNRNNNIAFLKSDKVINTEIKYNILETSINFYSSLSNPTNRLILQREFII